MKLEASSLAELTAMQQAGRELFDWTRILAKSGDSILGLVLGGARGGEPADWTHYPSGDVYDGATHAQYFFHRHAGETASTGIFILSCGRVAWRRGRAPW